MSEKFWILEPSGARTAKWDIGNIWRKSDYNEAPQDVERDLYIPFGGPANRVSELRVVINTDDVPDFVWTIPDCLIRTRTLEMFLRQGFTGFNAKTVQARLDPDFLALHSSRADSVPELWELLVTGWGGVADPGSGVSRITNTNIWQGYPDWSRIVDWNSWDGSDFFIVWPFAFTRLVTERVADFITQHELDGVELIAPEVYTHWYVKWNLHQTIPMRLRDHFPDERAKEIGEPLEIY